MTEQGEGADTGDADDDGSATDQTHESGELGLRWVEILGLYKPGHDDSNERGGSRVYRSGYEVGYTSDDDRGRIFVNHRPRSSASESWARVRVKDTQYIELIVEIDDPQGVLPADAGIEWTYTDTDDPSDEGMSSEAARLIDGQGTGGDNRGKCDHPTRDCSNSPTFERVAGYPLSNPRANGCRTAIRDGRSKVRFHCTNVGGDNYIVHASITGHPQIEIVTGVMSMWKRIDVEYHKLENTRDIPLDQVAAAFEPAFIQLDFTDPISFTMPAAADGHRYMTRGDTLLAPARALVRRLFRNRGQPGWFTLIAADLETSYGANTPVLYPTQPTPGGDQPGPAQFLTGPHPTGGYLCDWVVVDQVLAQPATAVIIHDGSRKLTLYAVREQVSPPNVLPTQTAVLLDWMPYHPEPGVGHGDYNLAVGPTSGMMMDRCWHSSSQQFHTDCGLRMSGTIQVILKGGRAIGAAGVTPTYQHGQRTWWTGHTIVFTGKFDQDPALYEQQVLRTTIHELCHGFGLAHACGNYSALGSGNEACPMHILDHWLVEPSSIRTLGHARLEQWESGTSSPKFCAGHLRALRMTHLEDNRALWRWS